MVEHLQPGSMRKILHVEEILFAEFRQFRQKFTAKRKSIRRPERICGFLSGGYGPSVPFGLAGSLGNLNCSHYGPALYFSTFR